MRRQRIIGVALGLVLLLTGCGGSQPASTKGAVADSNATGEVAEGITTGDRLPDVELTTFAGVQVHVQELIGRPLMVNFWATWCGPCRQEIPLLQQAYETNRQQGLQLIAITDESPETVRQYMADNNMSFPVLFDQSKYASNTYHVQGIPTTFFLDRRGVIVKRQVGALGANGLQLYLQEILESPTPTPQPGAKPGATGVPASPPAPAPTHAPTGVPPSPPALNQLGVVRRLHTYSEGQTG